MTHSFLLIGQSNMSGRGLLTAENRIADARIVRLVNGRWQPMWEPLSADRPFAGASLAPAFAAEYLRHTSERVGLIPASDGGSSIDEWQPGEALYDHAVSEARLAMRDSELKAIFWHQGEADCNPERAARYKQKFLTMFRALQNDLSLPDIKIYVGGLGDYLERCTLDANLAHYAHFNDILKELAAEHEDIRFVSAKGLGAKEDNLHFNTEALREFGRRYFAVYAADHPELACSVASSDCDEPSPAEQLVLMQEKKKRGEISDSEYDAFIKRYIATL